MSVKTYFRKTDGNTQLSANFKVSEFACNDGSDKVLISEELVKVLQYIRDELKVSININSGYRTPEYNTKIGGAKASNHMNGTAADLSCKLETTAVCKAAEKALAKYGIQGAIIRYTLKNNPNNYFTHVDVRASRLRQENRDGTAVNVVGWAESARPTLKKGDKGADVKVAQHALIKKGILLPKYGADSDFGAETETGAKTFQRTVGLEPNGIIDAKTWAALGL